MSDPDTYDEATLPPETAPEPLSITLKGFASEEEARRLGDAVWATVKALSRAIDLTRLDGVTVAFDYSSAVNDVDRGYATTFIQTPTKTNELIWVAMTVNVMRDNIVKAHLVFDAQIIWPILDNQNDFFSQSVALIAHECGHVADLRQRDEQFPGTLLRPLTGTAYERRLNQPAEVLWEEYAACRASALFCQCSTATYAESFATVLPVALDYADAAIRCYRIHGNINRVLSEAGNPLFEPMRTAAYLAGHLDGPGLDLASIPIASDALQGSLFEPLVMRMIALLRDLWDRRGSWPNTGAFAPLLDLCRDVFETGGIHLSARPSGEMYVQIPFTLATLPI